MGGRGASSNRQDNLKDGPTPGGGSGGNLLYGQPNTPQMRPPAPTIRGQIGDKGRPQAPLNAMKGVNPDINALDAMDYADYQENCQRCVVAYELNRRGYNVEAEATGRRDPYPRNDLWMTAFNGAEKTPVGGRTTANVNNNISNEMSKWGDKSRAIVEIEGPKGGHVFNVEYRNGKLYYYDAQHNVQYDPKRVFDHCTRSTVQIVRVDNLDIGDNVRDMVRKSRNKR